MKTKLTAALILLLCTSFAQASDFIRARIFTIKPECHITDILQLNVQFNEWGRAYKITGEVMVQVLGNAPEQFLWVHRTDNAQAWGVQSDAWLNAIVDGKPIENTLWERWLECTNQTSATAYYTFDDAF